MDERRVGCDHRGLARASQVVSGGGVIIFPTDTVYGLGCDPYDRQAVMRIYRTKSRDAAKPLPVLVDSVQTAQRVAEMGTAARRIAGRFWPGPLTIILRPTDAQLAGSLNLRDGGGIAIRMPDCSCALGILRGCRMLAGTSANVSGRPPTGDPAECAREICDYDLLVDGGAIPHPAESTIIDATGDEITMVRRGRLGLEEVLEGS